MNKSDLVQSLVDKKGMTYKSAEAAVKIIFDSMSDQLASGGGIEIRGFGSFKVKEYGAYDGRNPKTGEVIRVNAKKLPFFKVGKPLRERIDA